MLGFSDEDPQGPESFFHAQQTVYGRDRNGAGESPRSVFAARHANLLTNRKDFGNGCRYGELSRDELNCLEHWQLELLANPGRLC